VRDGERRSANQKDFGVSVASEDVLAFAERGTATRPDQATHDTAGVTVCKVHGIGAEGVPESLNSPDISRLTWVIIERSPNLPNQIGQVGVDDERVRPKAIVQLRFGQRLWLVLDENLEQLKGLR
jgi:hypothetical protein